MTRKILSSTLIIPFLLALATGAGAATSTGVWYKGKRINISHRYRKSGRELVLFIHGLACAKESFDGAWSEARLKKYSLLAVDLPGFGESSRPSGFSYKLEDHAGVVYELLRKFPQRKVHIVGHSMGGAVAVMLAKKNPRRFSSLMNVDGCLGSPNGNSQGQSPAPTFEEFSINLEQRIISSQGKPEEKGLRLWYDWSRASDPVGFNRTDDSLLQWTRSGKLIDMFLGLQMKKAYFYPDRDGLPSPLRRARNVRKIEVSKSGHFIMNDNPGEFYPRLAAEMAR